MKWHAATTVFLLLAISADRPASAQPPPNQPAPQVLTLPAFEQIALENNPSLARASALVDVAKGKWLQAGLYPNPNIGYHATEIGNLGTAGQQGAIFTQRIVTAGKLGLNRQIAEREIQWAYHQFEVQKQRVLSDTRIRFYDVLVAQQRVDLTRKLVKIGVEAVKASSTLHKGGLVGLNDVLQSKIEADGAEILFGKAQNRHREAWQRLAAVVGLPHLQPIPVAGKLDDDLPHFAWSDALSNLLAQSPELAAAHANAERARSKIQREFVQPIPDVDLIVSARHHNVTGDDVANVQVSFPIPIFNRNQGNIRLAKAEFAAALSEVRRLELDLQDRLAVAFRRYADARLQVDKYRQRIIPNAAQSLQLVQKGYQNRQIQYLTFLISQRTYFQVNLAYLAGLRELRESAAIIQGQLLQGSLRRPK